MQLEAAGIRRVAGKHLTLYTDLPRQPAIDELPRVFDLAVPQWCEFFAVEGQRVADWHMTAYLIGDKNLFRRVRVLRAGLAAALRHSECPEPPGGPVHQRQLRTLPGLRGR